VARGEVGIVLRIPEAAENPVVENEVEVVVFVADGDALLPGAFDDGFLVGGKSAALVEE